MKRFIVLTCLLFACNLLFAEIQWLDVKEDNEDGITAAAICYTEAEVLKITHWKDLESHFISYSQDKNAADADVYLVVFMRVGTVVYEYHKGSKAVGCYMKTVFE